MPTASYPTSFTVTTSLTSGCDTSHESNRSGSDLITSTYPLLLPGISLFQICAFHCADDALANLSGTSIQVLVSSAQEG